MRFSEASRAVQVRSFLASATISILTAQVVAVSLDGLYGLLYSVPTTVIGLVLGHHLLGRPLTRRPGADETPILIVDRPIFAPIMVLLGLGALPGVWVIAGWPAAAATALLVVVGTVALLRTQRRRH